MLQVAKIAGLLQLSILPVLFWAAAAVQLAGGLDAAAACLPLLLRAAAAVQLAVSLATTAHKAASTWQQSGVLPTLHAPCRLCCLRAEATTLVASPTSSVAHSLAQGRLESGCLQALWATDAPQHMCAPPRYQIACRQTPVNPCTTPEASCAHRDLARLSAAEGLQAIAHIPSLAGYCTLRLPAGYCTLHQNTAHYVRRQATAHYVRLLHTTSALGVCSLACFHSEGCAPPETPTRRQMLQALLRRTHDCWWPQSLPLLLRHCCTDLAAQLHALLPAGRGLWAARGGHLRQGRCSARVGCAAARCACRSLRASNWRRGGVVSCRYKAVLAAAARPARLLWMGGLTFVAALKPAAGDEVGWHLRVQKLVGDSRLAILFHEVWPHLLLHGLTHCGSLQASTWQTGGVCP